jgi:hypothetical protein
MKMYFKGSSKEKILINNGLRENYRRTTSGNLGIALRMHHLAEFDRISCTSAEDLAHCSLCGQSPFRVRLATPALRIQELELFNWAVLCAGVVLRVLGYVERMFPFTLISCVCVPLCA